MSERPANLSPEQLQLVLKRAVELDGRSNTTLSPSGATSEEELQRLAEEVGLEPATVRRALAELKVGTLEPQRHRAGPWGRLLDAGYGRSEVELQRPLDGTARAATQRLHDELARRLLRVKRHAGDTTVWEPDTTPQARLMRLADFSRKYDLALADELEVIAVDAGAGGEAGRAADTALVRLSARLPERRRSALVGSTLGAAAAAGFVAFVGWVIEDFSVLDAALTTTTAVGVLGWARGRYRRAVERAKLSMEQLLDALGGRAP
jgi:hypothetical protein